MMLVLVACGPAAGPSASRATASTPAQPAATPRATAQATANSTATSEATMADDGFRLTSPDFPAGGPIPSRYTCDGEDESPALAWEGAPAGTETLALIVDDPDAHGFVHWVMFDLTGSPSGGVPRGVSASPDAPPQGRNDFGRVGWGGPCPPSGPHH
jgi:phosphatidylethanolamine-binding protein (PEBP) family uncharacterized protein